MSEGEAERESHAGDAHDEEEDADAQQLRAATAGLKRQADELLGAEQHAQALRLYRELLMHLTRSHVKLMLQQDLVVSCRMNILAALSKLEEWPQVVAEASATLQVVQELRAEAERKRVVPQDAARYARVWARAYYFRGFARFRLGAYSAADGDLKQALALAPDDEGIQEDYEELQAAIETEQRVKQRLSASLKQFQARKYKLAGETCAAALREAQALGKDELTGLIHANMAAILVKTKDDARAVEHYKRALLAARKAAPAGGDASPAQHERVFDLLDALAGCYSRRKDYSSALSVIDDQVARFPQCPGRSEREAMMHLNGGRVCCTLGKFADAEARLRKAKAAAARARQTDVELHAAYWLSRALCETGKAADAMSLLDSAIPAAEQEQPENAELVGKLMLARLEWLRPPSAGKEPRQSADAPLPKVTPMRMAQLWHALEYFEKRQHVHGQLCASDALVSALCAVAETETQTQAQTQAQDASGEVAADEKREADILRALRVVDTVSIGKVPVADANILIRLVFLKVDMLTAARESRAEAKALLAKTLRSLQPPGRNEVSRRQQFRAAALHRLVEIVQGEEEEDHDQEVYEFLEEAAELLRREKDKDASAAVALGEMLRKVARFKASRGELDQAEELLEESAELPCGQMLVTLLPLCVVQLKQGKLRAASATMAAMQALPDATDWKEVAMVRQQLDAARAAEDARRREGKRKDTAAGADTAHVAAAASTTATATATATAGSWRWQHYCWLPLSLCAVLVAALVALWL